MTTNDFDPQALFHDAKGFSYENFAAYLLGDKRICPLNTRLQMLCDRDHSEAFCKAYSDNYRAIEAEEGIGVVDPSVLHMRSFNAALGFARTKSQTASPAGRDGGPGAVSAQAAPIHPADEPEVPGGVGA